MKLKALFGCAAVALLSTQAFAQEPQWFVGGGVGYNKSDISQKLGPKGQMIKGDKNSPAEENAQGQLLTGVEWNQNWRSYVTASWGQKDRDINKRQSKVLFSTDYMLPVNSAGTKLFAGLSAGANYMDFKNYGHDWAPAYGGQVGVMQKINDHWGVELGYQYLRHNNEIKKDLGNEPGYGMIKAESKVKNSQAVYLNATYKF